MIYEFFTTKITKAGQHKFTKRYKYIMFLLCALCEKSFENFVVKISVVAFFYNILFIASHF
jgi:hypothetical protein